MSEQVSNGRTPKEAERQARQWSDEFLQCRTYGHPWRPGTARWNGRYKFWATIEKCPRCTSERHRELTRTGKVMSSNIDYADGYLSEPGGGRFTGEARDMLVLATVTRTFVVEKINGKRADGELPHSLAMRRELDLEYEYGEAS